MKRRRITSLLLVLALTFSLAACGGGGGKEPTAGNSSDSSDSAADRFADLTGTDSTPVESFPEEGTDEYWIAKAAALNESTAEMWETYGDNFKWYYGDGVMAIRGTGTLENIGDTFDASIGKAIRSLTSSLVVVIEDGCTEIGHAAFYEFSAISHIIIPDSVLALRGAPFGHCNGLKTVTLPESVGIVGSMAFYQCLSLQEITLPDNLAYLSNDTFRKCSSLNQIHWKGTTYTSNDELLKALDEAGIPTSEPEPAINDGTVVADDIHIRVEGTLSTSPAREPFSREISVTTPPQRWSWSRVLSESALGRLPSVRS